MDEDLQKHTLNLFAGDYEKLKEFYPDTGAGAIIRRLVRKFIQNIEKQGEPVSIDLSINL